MIVVSVMYPPSARFDLDYYMKSHMKLVHERWESCGLQGSQVMKGDAGADGGAAPYPVITLLKFGSLQDFQNAVAKHGPEVMGDVPNFTDAQPSLQFNTPVS